MNGAAPSTREVAPGHAGRAPTFDPAEHALREAIEATHYWHLHRREVVRREVVKIAPPGAHLADVGCGIGTVATHLAAGGFRVDGLDLFEEALVVARRRAAAQLGGRASSLRFVQADVRDALPVRDVDGVLLLDVIEHLDDDRAALTHARDALSQRPGAFVLCTVPAFPLLWSPWDVIERHRRRYTPESLTSTLRGAGLEPSRTTCFFFPLFFAALAVKALRAARATVAPPPPPRDIRDLVEARSHPLLDRAMLALTRPERTWLARGRLPLGTSILTIAHRR